MSQSKREHWEKVWGTHPHEGVSWYAPHLAESLRLIREVAPSDANVIDVGGGASTLVDDLLDAGFSHITVLDIAEGALSVARARLGGRASSVTWLPADVTTVSMPQAAFDVWHDRAVFHFLTEPADRDAYVHALVHSLKPGGWVVIGAFALSGPARCSGLDVVRYDAGSLQRALGPQFSLSAAAEQTHLTPDGRPQHFVICRLQRSTG
jgi:2-polyprenyl-3-methyl-5-hydroxy-6-metoxy-1,4-benzoquinol methylase